METQSGSLDGSGRCNAQLGTTLPAGLSKDSFASGHGAIASGHSNPYVGCFQVQTTSASVSSRVRGAVGKIHRAHDAPSHPLYEFTKKLREIYVNSRLHGRCRP
jgi:hypothetical protein